MKVLIVEDEPAAARRLRKLLQEVDADTEVLDQLDSIESTLQWLNDHELPDLLLLDIHLADGSSFEIFQHHRVECPVIFITAYDQYAIEAFKHNTVDYLLKPVKRPELEKALTKYRRWRPSGRQIDYARLAEAMRQEEYQKRFLIRFGQNIRIVSIEEIAYFYTQDKITFLNTFSNKRYPVDYSLEKLEEMIDPAVFFRINRQFIININAIDEMYAYSKSRVKIELNPPCDQKTVVSTERSPVFKKWLVGEE